VLNVAEVVGIKSLTPKRRRAVFLELARELRHPSQECLHCGHVWHQRVEGTPATARAILPDQILPAWRSRCRY